MRLIFGGKEIKTIKIQRVQWVIYINTEVPTRIMGSQKIREYIDQVII